MEYFVFNVLLLGMFVDHSVSEFNLVMESCA